MSENVPFVVRQSRYPDGEPICKKDKPGARRYRRDVGKPVKLSKSERNIQRMNEKREKPIDLWVIKQ